MVNKEITKEMIDAARADVIMVDGPLFRDPVYKLKSRKNWSFNNEDAAVVAYLVDAITGRETAPHLMKRDLEKLEKRIRKAIEKVESKAGRDVYVGNIVTFSMDGLRTALQRYDENGKRGKCGPWEIHDGGYDRWWEIAYEGNVLVACHASGEYSNDAREFGNIERERHLADKTFSNICKIVGEEFPECRMAPKEQQKIFGGKKTLGR